jgi:hypothetical protein
MISLYAIIIGMRPLKLDRTAESTWGFDRYGQDCTEAARPSWRCGMRIAQTCAPVAGLPGREREKASTAAEDTRETWLETRRRQHEIAPRRREKPERVDEGLLG